MAENIGKLEEGLIQAMRAIDNQIARAMQRSPSERDVQGVQKWEPYETRVEHVAAFIINQLGDESVNLDGVIVLAQAFTKALCILANDLGTDGLGELRTAYCLDAVDKIERDAHRVKRDLESEELM